MHQLFHDAAILGAVVAWVVVWTAALVMIADLASRNERGR